MPSKSVIKEKKAKVVSQFGKKAAGKTDTGSAEVQVALWTQRINELNGHFSTNPKDHQGRLGLLKLVGKRKRMLSYLKNTDEDRYLKLIKSLELRK